MALLTALHDYDLIRIKHTTASLNKINTLYQYLLKEMFRNNTAKRSNKICSGQIQTNFKSFTDCYLE